MMLFYSQYLGIKIHELSARLQIFETSLYELSQQLDKTKFPEASLKRIKKILRILEQLRLERPLRYLVQQSTYHQYCPLTMSLSTISCISNIHLVLINLVSVINV